MIVASMIVPRWNLRRGNLYKWITRLWHRLPIYPTQIASYFTEHSKYKTRVQWSLHIKITTSRYQQYI